ncbi:MAG: acyl-CoA dehydrogenase family protein [Pseudomonadota bacterium]
MIDFSLTPEQLLLRDTARAFAAKEIAPLADSLYNGDERDADAWPSIKRMIEKGVELGFTRMLVPEERGGLGAAAIDLAIVLEELGAADVGFASDYFSLTATMPLIAIRGGSEAQSADFLERFLSQPMILAGAQSEPNTGGSELMSADADPKRGPKLPAVRDGDDYVLTGEKSAFITNAGVADAYFVLARTNPDKPVSEGLSIFEIPADAPGLSVSGNTELIGWRGSKHASLIFDGVRAPESSRYGAEGGAAMIFAQIPEMPVCLAACFVGLARICFDRALTYARDRVVSGRPIAEHQAVALKLSEMAVAVQSARLLVWDAAIACQEDPMAAATLKGPAAKTSAVDAAIRNAQRAMEIFGGYGVTKEYGVGRLLNDAWIGYACDFTSDILRLGMTPFLKPSGEV